MFTAGQIVQPGIQLAQWKNYFTIAYMISGLFSSELYLGYNQHLVHLALYSVK